VVWSFHRKGSVIQTNYPRKRKEADNYTCFCVTSRAGGVSPRIRWACKNCGGLCRLTVGPILHARRTERLARLESTLEKMKKLWYNEPVP
jgi:hypothetical protein